MKTAHIIPIISFMFLLFTGIHSGCTSSSKSSTKSSAKSNTVSQSEPGYGYTTILQMLRKESKLRIIGPHSNPQIRVMGGGRSIAGSSEPLFVVDGSSVGRGYTSVRGIDVNLVKYINVVSAANAGKYGSMGAMGVIEITTKVK